MIINTGQRTDIPAFYSKWFIHRILDGYVLVRNPYYPSLVTRFSLSKDLVDIIGFCTKNPEPMFKYLHILKEYGQFWYITITIFDSDLEPNVPSIDKSIENFIYLSKIVGKNAIAWRYTPIILNDKYTLEKHIETFKYIASKLSGYTSLVAYGFLDVYDKIKRNHPELIDTDDTTKIKITEEFLKIAKENHLELRLCSKEKWLEEYGVNIAGCMLLSDYEKVLGAKLIPDKKMQARKEYCSCFLSNDIGAYNSCMHLCTYCYANGNKNLIISNFKKHDDNSPFLIGSFQENDQIHEAKQASWKIK